METTPLIERAPYVVQNIFDTQRQPHMPIESDVGSAYTTPEGKRVIYTKSMTLHFRHLFISKSLGIAPKNIYIIANDMRVIPNSGPSTASRQQLVTGQAIKAACESLVNAMK